MQNEIPVTDSTRFNIMSITKNFIAAAVIKLADQNKISLDAQITKYLKSLPVQYDNVKVYHLLSHSSGIPDYVHVHGYMLQANRRQNPMEILKTIIDKPLEYIPGEKTSYSNSNYFLLGLIIEKVTGMALDKYLKTNIFEPAVMKNTYLETSLSNDPIKAKGYTYEDYSLNEVKPLDPSQYWAAGGIVSTLNNMIKWNKALSSGTIVTLDEINQMMQSVKLNDGSLSSYGLGFELMNSPNMKIAGNNGAGIGYNASFIRFLNDSVTVTVLTNTTNGNSSMIAKNIHDIIIAASKNESALIQDQSKTDKLDSLVINIITDAESSVVNEQYFGNVEAANKFKNDMLHYIQTEGKLTGIVNRGEKINPASIVRKYEIGFEKGSAILIIIFSKEGKILLVNRM